MNSEPYRLHPAAIAVLALSALRDAAFPIVILLGASIAGRGLDSAALERSALYLVLGVAIASLMGVVRWRSTSYAVDERGVHYQTGIVSRKATTVPLSRIQGLDTVAGPVQRLFGVVALHVQSAGGGKKGEIVLEAVGPAEVERIRAAVRAERPELPEAAAAHAVVERRLGRRELLVAALTAGQLGVILPVLAASGQLLSNAFSNERDIEGATRLLPDTPGGWELALAALLVGAWALSAIGSLVSFAGFTVSRDGDRLRIRRGLLQRSDAVVPIRRIHAVRVVEGVLRRPFGLATLRLEVAGYAEEASAARTLYPLLPRREVAAFLAELLPELADEPDGLTAPPPRAARRYVLPPAVLGLIAGAAACVLVPSAAPWPLLVAPLLGLNGWWSFQAAGWRLRDGRLAMRSRRLARTTLLTPAARLQEHAVAQNPFQRRAGLADLAVAVGKGGHARVRHLEAPVAADLWERLRR
ncbi:MAG: putative rane protein [Solirubrobacteraceae bacterium]|nr:putative rane protein [Solirubrobacteraceae bacterium]